jgi:GPH family glycoside/pentoside/hexuronide:cation symporter
MTASQNLDSQRADRVAWPARIAFGVGDFSLNLVWQGTALFLMFVYTDVLGIAPTIAGAIYLAAMVLDAVTDPIVAVFVERTRTRFGRYRPWLLAGCIPLAISYPLAFSAPPGGVVDPVWWALFTHLFLRMAYTVVGVPFSALQARLTGDANERARLAGFRMLGAACGGLGVVFVTPLLVDYFGPEREAEAYFVAASLAGLFTGLGLAYCALVMREPAETGQGAVPSLISDLRSIPSMFLGNVPLMQVFAIITVASICLGMFSKNVLYYFKYVAGREDLAIFALVMPAALLLVAVPGWVRLATATSKSFALQVGCLLAMIGYVAFWIVPADQFALLFAAIACIGLGSSALAVLFWSMLPDTVEYGEWKTGVRAEAKVFGFATFAQKAAVGINALLLGLLLNFSGFSANREQAPDTLFAMEVIMVGIPFLGALTIALIARSYRLDKQLHDDIRRKLAGEVDAGHSASLARNAT